MKYSKLIMSVVAAGTCLFGSNVYAKCDNCGTVTDIKTVQQKGKGSGVGLIAGGVLGGVLGHQVGGGRGRDVATAVGVLGGGAVGANVGRNNNNTTERDVQRCETVQNGRPEQWDVRYNFKGIEHNMQMTTPPGATISVNRNGEPRL